MARKGRRSFKTQKQAVGFRNKLPFYGFKSVAKIQKIRNKSKYAKRKYRYEVTWSA